MKKAISTTVDALWTRSQTIAHQGGWDEILLVATPLGLLATVLWLANRRARRLKEAAPRFPSEVQLEHPSVTDSLPGPDNHDPHDERH